MPDSISTKIRELQIQGWSTKAISNHLHIANTTTNRYLDKNKFSSRVLGYIKSNERKRKRLMDLDFIEIPSISADQARQYAALLYWCEGSKYPASNKLAFTTSDGQMLKLFLGLFRKGFDPIESKFRVWVQFHSDQDKDKIFKYWSSILRIPTSQFLKPGVTEKQGGRYRRVYRGTCSLRYGDYSMILRLMGIYQRFYKQAMLAII